MKKALSLLLCYAFGMVALSDDAIEPVSSIDFEYSRLWGKVPRFGLDEDGVEGGQGNSYWYYLGSELNLSFITNYNYGETRYSNFNTVRNPMPSYMHKASDNNGYVSIRALSPLARTFSPVDSSGASDATLVPADNGLYIDQLVRFFPTTNSVFAVPPNDVNDSAKFLVWLSGSGGATNLVLTAGRYNSNRQLRRRNYPVMNTVVAGRWYRLTVRVIANAATLRNVEAPAFVAYLDGVPLTVNAVDYQIGDDFEQMADTFAGNPFYAACALFPMIREFTTIKPSLRGMAVQGIAHYDEFAVVNDANPLAKAAATLPVTVALDPDKVTNVVCSVTAAGEAEPYFVTNSVAEAAIKFTVKPGDRVLVEPLTETGYSLATALNLSGNMSSVKSQSGYEFSLVEGETFADSSELAARINVGNANFRVGDATYELFNDALEAAMAAGEPMIMERDVTLDPETENGQMFVKPKQELTLDLHGRKIVGQNMLDEAAIYNQGRMTIIDSVGGGSIVASGDAIAVVADNDALEVGHSVASLQLGNTAQLINDFTVRGRVRVTKGELAICGGTYLTPPALEPTDAFYLTQYVDKTRFSEEMVSTEEIGGKQCHNWRVNYDGRVRVCFTAEHGEVEPASTNVDMEAGKKLVEPKVTAVGYSLTGWNDAATGESWDFATDEISGDMTLRAQQQLDTYSINYDYTVPSTALRSYTVVGEYTALPQVTRYNYKFTGWKDESTGYFVEGVGAGALFRDTLIPVAGDLNLKATWQAESISWTNAGGTESNGTYSSSWKFVVPTRAGLAAGDKVAIDEIAFGIVNPLLYPKSSSYLTVEMASGEKYTSAARFDFYDSESGEYLVSGQPQVSGRARLGYGFSDLTVLVGKTNTVYFSTATGEMASGFLRLVRRPAANDPLFSNCLKEGAPGEFERYTEYCPLYEVTGHEVEEVTP